jgi:hypothetical protein
LNGYKGVLPDECHGHGGAGKGSYRFVPPGTGWDRLGPDKFFSPRMILEGKWSGKSGKGPSS